MTYMSSILRFVGAGLAILVALPSLVSGQTPAALPPWTPGTLDIHHLATGQGNSTFFVLPDGTTMLVDAGAATPVGRAPIAPPVPDGSRSAGEWIARYVTRMAPPGRDPEIDYALLTHFHADHMGFISAQSPQSAYGDYQLAGITDIAERVPIRRVIDRGWPDYDYPEPLDDPSIVNYRRFLEARQRDDGLSIERFGVGRSDQIRLIGDPTRYPTFEIRNLHANGEVWTGTGDATAQIVPPLETVPKVDWPIENHCSLAFLLRYGPFSYYTGGDLQGVPPDGYPAWHDQETPIARAIGGPVDVAVIGHHGSIEPANAFFLATLRPRVDIVPAWSTTHPAPVVLKRLLNKRIYTDPRDIFVLEFRDETKAAIGSRAGQVASDHGHVLVRVAPGGASYQVFVLDDRVLCGPQHPRPVHEWSMRVGVIPDDEVGGTHQMTYLTTLRFAKTASALVLGMVSGAACVGMSGGEGARKESSQDEVRVGYGSQNRTDVTGAVATVRAEDIGREITSIEDLLQGLAGVTVRRLGNGGISLRVRGSSSLSSDGEPLYVINGVPIHAPPGQALMGISARDITRIDVLKDAGATAIYGSRGANGVVLIFTVRRGLNPN